MNRKIRVEAYKFNRVLHRSWNCELIAENEEYWIFEGVFDEEIRHPLLGVIRPGTRSFEFYWKSRWYNVFRFHEPEGELRNFYCNVNLPPILRRDVLSYVDLDIDVLVAPDLSYRILDLDEFADNAENLRYPAEIIEKSEESLQNLISLIENKRFPFDYQS